MTKYFFELSGEHPTMPAAEAYACIKAESDRNDFVTFNKGPGYVIAEFDDRIFENVTERIALTQKAGMYLGSFDADDTAFERVTIPEGTFAVRARRYEGMMPNINTQDLVKKFGRIHSEKNDVSLDSPDVDARLFISDKIHVFVCDASINRTAFEKRKVSERPFFSPISLHPKFARACVNLTSVRKGGIVLDPFCGTGGIAIEAASMGMKVAISDIDERMIVGCMENMDHYNLKLYDSDVLDIGDIGDRFTDVDAIVTDPPYGRSTHTAGENAKNIHERSIPSINRCLRSNGRAVVVLPYELQTNIMTKEDVHAQKVHGSLTRHYHVLLKQ
ncbi:MAG: RsmD family RNA methyltransferase [Methanomassiliicoccaceae archaeon]|nr:RsmD family RNA methyltransferase [Methanomassiliicoccaceae archaeon]